MKQRNLFLFFTAGLVCLAMMRPLLAAEDSKANSRLQGTVTQKVIESKVAEVEAGSGQDELAKDKLLKLYRKALSNLQTAASNEQSALAFQQSAKDAPATIKKLSKETDEVNADATFSRKLSATLQEIEEILQQEKTNLAAQDAKLLETEQRLQEEAGRASIIRQRILEVEAEAGRAIHSTEAASGR